MDPVVHFEMPYDDRGRITKFYESVFGWQLQLLGEDMGDYVLATTATSDVKKDAPSGAINGGFYPNKPGWPAHYPSIVISVSDIHECMQKIVEAGGKVLGETTAIPGIGFYTSFLDTEGNRNSILQPAASM